MVLVSNNMAYKQIASSRAEGRPHGSCQLVAYGWLHKLIIDHCEKNIQILIDKHFFVAFFGATGNVIEHVKQIP